VLSADGKIGQQTMPVSVSAGDLNKDGLNDIAIMDGQGFLRVHFNTGTKQEPKFGPAEFSSLLLNPTPLRLSDLESVESKEKSKPTPTPKATPRPAAAAAPAGPLPPGRTPRAPTPRSRASTLPTRWCCSCWRRARTSTSTRTSSSSTRSSR
jgi:hypothetical protein